jgi:hypothetical protein
MKMETKPKRSPKKPVRREIKMSELDIAYAKLFPSDLIKDPFLNLNHALDDTLYRWWWECMKAAEDFPEVAAELISSRKAGSEHEKKIESLRKDFGKLKDNFASWWVRGKKLFQERGVPTIEVLRPKSFDDDEYLKTHGLVVQIPMTISRELLMLQFEVLLRIYHSGRTIRRHEASTAKRKIFPRANYPETAYEDLLKFWKAQKANERSREPRPLWEVYCQFMGLNDQIEALRSVPIAERTRRMKVHGSQKEAEQRKKYTRDASKLFTQADELIKNAIIGEFPNDTQFQTSKHGAAQRARVLRAQETPPKPAPNFKITSHNSRLILSNE